MALPPGTRLGVYEVMAAIGAGGMGEIYRARDTKLNRDVALKVLPEAVAGDRDRLARFEREAMVLASLNHPNIAQVYGLEDTGAVRAIVMELVEGDDLAARLRGARLSAAETTAIALQIADALAAAHERGIVHRDLKPANIKLRADETVKVLDFGLAKSRADFDAAANTITREGISHPGLVMGTVGYMSPEQAAGREVDSRTDIWAFGCVLFEMLSGRRPFDGASTMEAIAAVINAEPDWTAIASSPPNLQSLVRRCLRKDPRQRLQHVGDARIWLEDSLVASAAPTTAAKRSPWLPAVAGVMVTLAIGWPVWRYSQPEPVQPVMRLAITSDPGRPFTGYPTGTNIAIARDGSFVLVHAIVGDDFQLVRRPLDASTTTPIPGTERAQNPALSPDGAQIAFYRDGAIRTVSVNGGSASIVCELHGNAPFIAWSGKQIWFAALGGPLMRVPERGGVPTLVATPDPAKKENFFGISPLPDGVLVNVSGGSPRVAAARTATTELVTIVERAGLAAFAAGRLLYRQANQIHVAPFDPERLTVTGEARVIETNPVNGYVVADTGTLLYIPQRGSPDEKLRLRWLSSEGLAGAIVGEDVVLGRHVRIAPDGNRAAIVTGGLNSGQLWIYDLRGSAQPIRLGSVVGVALPQWSTDGKAILFHSNRSGWMSIAADGSAFEPTPVHADVMALPEDRTADGAQVLFRAATATTGGDIMSFDRQSGATRPWLQTTFSEGEPSVSPDGTLVAYVSDQTNRAEVWVRPMSGESAPLRLSADGGHEPRWSKDGRTVFFQSGARMMSIALESRSPLRAGPPRVLFEGGFVPSHSTFRRTFDVAVDGRFLVVTRDGSAPEPPLVVITNALAAVPAGR